MVVVVVQGLQVHHDEPYPSREAAVAPAFSEAVPRGA